MKESISAGVAVQVVVIMMASYKAAMTKSGEITKTGERPIYEIELSSANGSESCPNGGYVWVQFQVGDNDNPSKRIRIRTTDNDSNSWLFVDKMGGKCFEGDKYFEGDKDKESIVDHRCSGRFKVG